MGSTSDWDVMSDAAATLAQFGVEFEKRVVSAHRTPDLLVEYAKTAKSRGLEVSLVATGTYIIGRSLSAQIQRAGQDSFTIQSPFYGSLHGFPYLLQVIPNVAFLAFLDVLPVTFSGTFTPLQYFGHTVHFVYIRGVYG